MTLKTSQTRLPQATPGAGGTAKPAACGPLAEVQRCLRRYRDPAGRHPNLHPVLLPPVQTPRPGQ